MVETGAVKPSGKGCNSGNDHRLPGLRLEMTGTPLSPGYAIGKAHVLNQVDFRLVEIVAIEVEDTGAECLRLGQAIETSREQLEAVVHEICRGMNEDIAGIIEAHRCILEDRSFFQTVKDRIAGEHINAEFVLFDKLQSLEERFAAISDEYAQARIMDIRDVVNRVLRNLMDVEQFRSHILRGIDSPGVLVAESMLPSDLSLLEFENVQGIVIERASTVSHVVIMARAMGVPAVVNVPGLTEVVAAGSELIVNGETGSVIINPERTDVERCRLEARKRGEEMAQIAEAAGKRGCWTRDGVAIGLEANISTVDDAGWADAEGAEGIGLLRSELAYMTFSSMPSPEDERDFYREIMSVMKDRPVTIRLLDLGADKMLSYLQMEPEANPQLGCRGIRFLLRHRDIMKRQVRSIFEAGAVGCINLLLPFVSVVEDLEESIGVIEDEAGEAGIPRTDFNVGIMVEIPSVAMAVEAYLPLADFLTVGTNDLSQYLFAVGRENSTLNRYRQTAHPALLTLIRDIVSKADKHGKPVSVCGEIASDPVLACLLVGLGIRKLSMHPRSIPYVRRKLSAYSLNELKTLAGKALACRKEASVRTLIREHL